VSSLPKLKLGLEGTTARADQGDVWALGATAGARVLVDLLGAETTALGVLAGWPLAFHPGLAELKRQARPELYLSLNHAF